MERFGQTGQLSFPMKRIVDCRINTVIARPVRTLVWQGQETWRRSDKQQSVSVLTKTDNQKGGFGVAVRGIVNQLICFLRNSRYMSGARRRVRREKTGRRMDKALNTLPPISYTLKYRSAWSICRS